MTQPATPAQASAALAAGATLVTASARQARHLLEAQGLTELAQGNPAWRAGDALPWDAWLRRLHAGALASGSAGRLPALLSGVQALALWQRIIEDDFLRRQTSAGGLLLQPAAAAQLAAEARHLALAWGIDTTRLRAALHSDDSAAFLRWTQQWERRLAEGCWLEADALADHAARWLASIPALRPTALWLVGFEELTPQQRRLCEAIEALGVTVRPVGPHAVGAARIQRVACEDPAHELSAAAAWARRQLESDPACRLAIVVPDLAGRRAALERALSAALDPAAWWGEPGHAPPWNFSLGLPLLEHPLVHDALLLLELADQGLGFSSASRLLRSPFLRGGVAEHSGRLRLERSLRQRRESRVTLQGLAARAGEVQLAQLEELLAAMAGAAGPARRRTPGHWVHEFVAQLSSAGWPGDRPLDSAEHQAVQAWLSLLREFAGLDGATGTMDHAAALGWLRRLAAAQLFQPQGASAPVQVLGMLEVLGQGFDGLWLMGLHDEAWPAPARPNPLLPLRLQRELGLPRASAARELEYAERMTSWLLQAAPEVVVSWPGQSDERTLRVSPLIAELPVGEPVGRGRELFFHQSFEAETEEYSDTNGPPLEDAAGPLRGGTRALVDQAQCPFRAFAAHRLHAEPLEEPGPGLDAAGRGMLVHVALDRLWAQLGGQAALRALAEPDRQRLLGGVVATAIEVLSRRQPVLAEPHCRALEQQRLEQLLEEWLQRELDRPEFTVVAREQPIRLSLGPLHLNGRIDRIDELHDGTRILIDYKTGKRGPQHWVGERPRDPQLPIYAVGLDDFPDALAVAQVRAGACRWAGVASDDGLLPGIRAAGKTRGYAELEWSMLVTQWRQMARGLAEALAAGDAAVLPLPNACQYCSFTALCRINDLRGAFSGKYQEEDVADDEQPAD